MKETPKKSPRTEWIDSEMDTEGGGEVGASHSHPDARKYICQTFI